MKEYIEIFKNLWANKRIRALIILVLYAVFFTIVILSLSGEKETVVPVKNTLMEFRDDRNYQYELVINDTETYNITMVEGYPISIPEEVDFLNNKFIYDLSKLGKLEGINSNYTEKYKDSIYKISGNDVITLIDINTDIVLTIREKEEKIEKVIIEFDQTFNDINKIELNY